MNTHERNYLILGVTVTILITALVTLAVTYPKPLEQNIIYYNNWRIYPPSNTTTTYVAMRDGWAPISNGDLPDLLADIDEAAR